jgi:Cu2+-exporting ATPase
LLRYVGLIITTPILLYSGAPFFTAAWRSVTHKSLGMDVPVAAALVLAYVASAYNTFRGSGQTYFDSVAMFIFLLSIGRFVETTVRRRSLSAGDALGRSLPATVARVKADQSIERISIHDIAKGDCLSVPRGAVIPVDSTLMRGVAFVDESLVTGESTAIRRSVGERLLGGGVNTGDAIRIVAEQTVQRSTLASIVALLERAQSDRPPLTRAADRAASWFVGAVLVLAIAVFVAWWFLDSSRAFPAALAVLVVTCPCALSLATPVATAAATLRLARLGVLVTRPDALERLSRVDTIVLDKTGTLTSGEVRIQQVEILGSWSREAALAIGAALERESNHPLGRAFAQYADASIIAEQPREIAGLGVEGKVHNETWRIGKLDYVAELSNSKPPEQHSDGVFLGNTSGLVASFAVDQEIRREARAAIRDLKALGLAPIMASGDRDAVVLQTACALGIERAAGRLNPQQKLELLKSLQSEGHRALMIGDGINDGPVLAAADVSCAMGEGSAIAHAASDLLLMRDALDAVPESIRVARKMFTVIRQNLGWSLFYNLSAVPLAALDLLPPWVAALGMSLSSLIVVLNSQRLTRSTLA